MSTRSRRGATAAHAIQVFDRALAPGVERRTRRAAGWAARRLQYLAGHIEGLAYRLGGQHPDPDVDDAVLVQRIRSSLGPVEKRLDLPRIHVMSTDHVVDLHGTVGTDAEARALEEAVGRVPGVEMVRSHLHIGMGRADTRPSEGRAAAPPSLAWRELVGAARATGLTDEEDAELATRAVLATLFSCLPDVQRRHVLAHLPADVRRRAHSPLEVGRMPKPRSIIDFERAVSERCLLPVGTAALAARGVLDALQRLVPEEVHDVEAVLPAGLKPLWSSPTTARA